MSIALPAQPNRSLMDGLVVLRHLAVARSPRGATELARELGFEITRVNRLLKTLAHLGFAQRTKARSYAAGSGMHVLAAHALFGSGFLQRALPHLTALTRFEHTVAYGVLWGQHVSYLYHWSPGMAPKDGLGRLAMYPAAKSSIGIVLLAQRPDDEITSGLECSVVPRAVTRARTRGYGEVCEGTNRSIAIPVGSPVTAALAMSGTIGGAHVTECIDALSAARTAIEAELDRRSA